MPHLSADWPLISRELQEAAHLLLLFDLDGTLAPIVDRPECAGIPAETRHLLRRLAALPGCRVGFVSGRSLDDLESRVMLPGTYYAGNHGMELKRPDGVLFRTALIPERRADLAALHHLLSHSVGQVPGVFIENKGLSLSLHYRRVRPQNCEQVRAEVTELLRGWRPWIKAHEGKMVFEIRAAGSPGKGNAVRRIFSFERNNGQPPMVFYFGDDVGDEPAFYVASSNGYAVRVGSPQGRSCADYHVAGTEELAEFLALLVNCRGREADVPCLCS